MEGSPNALAYLALVLCPFVSAVVVAALRAPIAVPLVILAGQMFMPAVVALDAPLLPALDKDIIVPLSALLACAIFRPKSLARSRPGRGYDLFIVLHIVGALGTWLTNRDALRYGPVVLQGHTAHDFVSGTIRILLYWWPPFFLGRTLYRTSKDLRTLFVIVAGAGLVYSVFLFIEMRMSPQLNRWVYGFHQSEFLQTVRGGGYRPKAFMRHGINVALFMVMTVLAAAGLARARYRVLGYRAAWVALYLLVVLVMCKSMGALVYVALALPVVRLARPRTQTRLAAAIALLVFCYPVARTLELVPIRFINDSMLSLFGTERAGSLAMRLDEEGSVLRRAFERIWFGWGGYARPFLHDENTGQNTTVIDGLWAITIGTDGAVGFVAVFGMLLLPAWRARRALSRVEAPRDRALVGALSLMTAIYALDLIPNSSVDPYLTFLVGVLAGAGRGLQANADQTLAAPTVPAPTAQAA